MLDFLKIVVYIVRLFFVNLAKIKALHVNMFQNNQT